MLYGRIIDCIYIQDWNCFFIHVFHRHPEAGAYMARRFIMREQTKKSGQHTAWA